MNINLFSTTGLESFDEILQPIVTFSSQASILTAVMAFIVCIAGYRFLKITTSMISFLAFSGLGSILLSLSGLGKSALILGIFCGIAATVLSYLFSKFGVFVSCCTIGYFIGYGIFSNMPIGITIALTLGILGLVSTKYTYIFATSVAGSVIVAITICNFYSIPTTSLPSLFILVPIVICSFILQYADNRNSGVDNLNEKDSLPRNRESIDNKPKASSNYRKK